MANKMGNQFVALASVAVGVVYGAGYLVTQGAPSALAGQTSAPKSSGGLGNAVAASAPAQTGSTGNGQQGSGRHHDGEDGEHGEGHDGGEGGDDGGGGTTGSAGSSSASSSSSGTTASSSSSSSTASSSSTSSKSSTASSTQKYLNGTYSGSGSNQIGTVQVSVTIQSDKITDVQITGCYTHYPQDYIDPVLPQQVLAQQNTNISYVSGATLSSMDFQDAVNQALQQAANPNYHGA